MRGILLITVAVILIVLGLRSSGDDPQEGPPVPEEGLSNATLDPRGPLNGHEAAIAAPEVPDLDPAILEEVADQGDPAGPAQELPFVMGEDPELAPVPDQGGQPVEPWSSQNVRSSGDDLEDDGIAITEASAGRYQLGAPGGESGTVARALLEAWIEQSPAKLQVAMDGEHGSQAAQDQARAAGMFWQAMVGRPELAEAEWEQWVASGSLTPAQLEMLRAAIDFDVAPSVPENAGRRDPLARSMRMVLLDAAANRMQDSSKHQQSAEYLSELMLSEINAPWKPHRAALIAWAQRLNSAQTLHRLHPTGDWPALTHRVAPNESLELIRKRIVQSNPGMLMCTGLIARVNRVGQYIHAGDVLRIPTQPANMLVDLDARMAFYRHGSEIVRAWDVGIGKEGKDTPVGTYTVGDKLKEPAWMRRGKPSLPYGHPENLLGSRWLGWYQDGVKTDYGFHGTNDEAGVGGRVSSGCIRMRNTDVEELFDLLPAGAMVIVQP